jgi:hypothetical protein
MFSVLATDNADRHSAETWGKATAIAVCPFDDTLGGERLVMAEAMRGRLQVILTRYHDTVQCIEQTALAADAAYIHTAFGAGDLLDSVMEELFEATLDTPWQFLWGRADVRDICRDIIDSHVRTNQQHEREHFARAHPDNSDCQQFLNFFQKA